MMALWMAIFFSVTAAVAWLALFPAARDGVLAGADRLFARLAAVLGRWGARAGNRAAESSQSARASSQRAMDLFGRHRNLLLAAAVLLTIPPLVILQLRQQVTLDGFEGGTAVASDGHVLELLRGERLAPPPELPPAVFVAAEAELLRSAGTVASAGEAPQAISGADRKWNRIDPAFQQRVLAIYQVMREQYGYQMVLVEGYRSPERQAALARKGGSTTRAGAGQSCHQYGLAVDSALYRDGKLQWDMGDAWTRRGYFLYGRLAQEAGLEWGGSWRSIKDYVHLELKTACREARRAAGH
ncbi:M15 family metallopeptidase [Novilysobacter erysipheiresistens]